MKVFYLSKRAMIIVVVIIVLLVLALVFSSAGGEGLASVFKSKEKLIPIYNVDKKEKVVAISFDAAWGDEYTEEILNILDEYEVKTTFFLVGLWIDKYPDKIQSIVDAGHEIGNHSTSHPDMTKLNKDKINEEIKTTNDKILKYTNKKTILFRPPFGAYDNKLIETVEEMGCYTIQWDVDSSVMKCKVDIL